MHFFPIRTTRTITNALLYRIGTGTTGMNGLPKGHHGVPAGCSKAQMGQNRNRTVLSFEYRQLSNGCPAPWTRSASSTIPLLCW